MRKFVLIAALLCVAVVAPAQAHHGRGHRHHAVNAPLPESIVLKGKVYKVCRPGMEDDCVQPGQARSSLRHRYHHHHPHHVMAKHP